MPLDASVASTNFSMAGVAALGLMKRKARFFGRVGRVVQALRAPPSSAGRPVTSSASTSTVSPVAWYLSITSVSSSESAMLSKRE